MSEDIKIGTAGWAYKDWGGIVYPARLKREEHPAQFMARYFDVVEINSSFYGHIKPEIGILWCRQARAVNPQFVFTAKLNRAFTHSPFAIVEPTSAATIRPTPQDESLAKQGLDAIACEGMLGAVLAQFPISFKNTGENRQYLERLLSRFQQYPLVVEVRHASWNEPEVLDRFSAAGIGFCNVDQPRLGLAIGATEHVTSGVGYVRLHGRNYNEWFRESPVDESEGSRRRDARYDYLYRTDELEDWKRHIEGIRQRARVTFVVANNHFRGKAAVNALQLKHMITGRPVKVPPTLLEHYWELESIAEDDTPLLFVGSK